METHPPSYYSRVALLLALAVMVSVGCSNDSAQSPEEVVTSFFSDLRMGERERAMEAIWPPTRDEIQGADEDLKAFFDGKSPVEPSDLLVVARLESPMLISGIDSESSVPEAPEEGERLVLRIEFRDERSAQLPVRWGADKQRWFVDLPVEERRPLKVNFDSVLDRGDSDVDEKDERSDAIDDKVMEANE